MTADSRRTAPRIVGQSNGASFRSPPGFLSYPCLDQPDRTFNPEGVFSAGLHLTVAELSAVEAELRALFDAAFPGEAREPHLPFRRSGDGAITLTAKSRHRPPIVDDRNRPLVGVRAGNRVRLIGRASAYCMRERVGVTVHLNKVQLIALDARDPRRERAALEREALRQAAARVRAGLGEGA